MATLIKKLLKLRTDVEAHISDLPNLMLKAERAVDNMVSGMRAKRKAGGHEEFWQFREYTATDRPQDIDWRQSAKTQRIFIRQKEWHNAQDNIFWCARHSGMNFEVKAAHAKILTLALSILLTRNGENVAFMNGARAGRSENALENIGVELLQDDETAFLPKAAHIAKDVNLVFIGDFLSDIDDIKQSFEKFAGHASHALVIQVLSEKELELPYSGHVVFEGLSPGAREEVRHVGSIRTQYKDRLNRHIQNLHGLCSDYGWHYGLHHTGLDISETLHALWLEMNQ